MYPIVYTPTWHRRNMSSRAVASPETPAVFSADKNLLELQICVEARIWVIEFIHMCACVGIIKPRVKHLQVGYTVLQLSLNWSWLLIFSGNGFPFLVVLWFTVQHLIGRTRRVL